MGPCASLFEQGGVGGIHAGLRLPSREVACLIAFTGPIYALIGPDAAVHIPEEVPDASRIVPLAMVSTLVINGVTGLAMAITYAYCLGPLDAATEPETISNVATASRQMFAFARDRGIPFARFFSHICPGLDVPLNAILISALFTALLSLINLGSTVAFKAILAIGVVALLKSYITSIGYILLKRIRGEELLPRRWSLGVPLGWFCNIVGWAYVIVAFIFAFFPISNHPSAVSMNWASAVYGGVAIVATAYYFLYARRLYIPPLSRLA
ncbi:putative amino-acid permease [Lachnellula suecica]|uniref:Putative amino-acid permease n=1 Tax=Lachnellula suecica TaxID=602035 RepID=A0A8T9BT95_9HELO|nr:putative amino-acid permease [Lachnellula suecica]